MRKRQVRPFKGLVTSVDARNLSDMTASDLLNVRLEDGNLNPRYGFKNLQAAQAGFAAFYGFDFLEGYNDDLDTVREYVTIEDLSGTVEVWNRSVETMAPGTQITNKGVPPTLHASPWQAFSFHGISYFINPNNEVYSIARHDIADDQSWNPLQIPTTPATELKIDVLPGAGTTSYPQRSWAGMTPSNPAHMYCTGRADTSAGSFTNGSASLDSATGQIDLYHLKHSATAKQASIKLDLSATSAGNADWTNVDVIALQLAAEGERFKINPASIVLDFENSSAVKLNQFGWTVKEVATPFEGFHYSIRVEWFTKGSEDDPRSIYGAVRYVTITYEITESVDPPAGGVANRMTVAKPIQGGVWIDDDVPSHLYMGFGYSYLWKDAELNSAPFGSAYDPHGFGLNVARWIAKKGGSVASSMGTHGYRPIGMENQKPLGSWIKFTPPVSADSNVTHFRLYYVGPDSTVRNLKWYQFLEQSDGTLTYTLKQHLKELFPELYEPTTAEFLYTGCVCATPMKGWVVWGYKGGESNIRHSKVGFPEVHKQKWEYKGDPEPIRGETFTMADNQADDPVQMHAIGNVLIMLGGKGVYAQVCPEFPSSAMPPHRLAGARGCANQFSSARFKDDTGNPGVVWVDPLADGVWYVQVRESFTAESGFQLGELTAPIRGTLKTFLIDEQSLTPADIRVWVDENRDALWVVAGKRALVLRRPDAMEGLRSWEKYDFTMTAATIAYVNSDPTYRMRWVRTDGKADENEWDRSAAEYIVGSLRDGGFAMPAPYWQSKRFEGPNRRVDQVRIVRDNESNAPTLQWSSTRQTRSLAFEVAKKQLRFGSKQTGWDHQFKLTLGEDYGTVRLIEWEEMLIDRRRTA